MKKPVVIMEELYTIPQTCEILGVDRRSLRRFTAAGAIASHVRCADGRIVYYGKDIYDCYYRVI